MIKEFAVDPALYISDNEWLIVFQHFGFHLGRIISKFPSDWERRAYRTLNNNSRLRTIEKHRMLERLNNLRKFIIDFNRPFEENLNWYQNALKDHKRVPFQAIISKVNPDQLEYVIKMDQLDAENKLWCIQNQITEQRKFDIIAPLMKNIFLCAKRIILVDPHFHPKEKRYRSALKSLCEEIFKNKQIHSIEYHLSADPRESSKNFENSCNHFIKPFIPAGKELKFIRWESNSLDNPNSGGQRLHPRFVLTDFMGINIEWGLDNGNDGDFTIISILNQEVYKNYWQQHQKESTTYVFVDEIVIKGGNS